MTCDYCGHPIKPRGEYIEVRVMHWNKNRGRAQSKKLYHMGCHLVGSVT